MTVSSFQRIRTPDVTSNEADEAAHDGTLVRVVDKGVAGGVAPLDGDAKVPIIHLPDATYANLAAISATQRFAAKIKRNVSDVALLNLSDSTANDPTDWFYLWAVDYAPLHPTHSFVYHPWADGAGDWGTPETLQTGSGPYTVHLWNGSWAGKNCIYPLAPNFETMVASKQPDLVIISHGHNEGAGQTDDQWRGPYLALTTSVGAACPTARIICIAQPPATANDDQAKRANVYQQVAEMGGYGFVDVHQLFVDTGDVAALLSDGIHPNADGSALWAALMLLVFTTATAQITAHSQAPSHLTSAGEQLLDNGDFAAFSGSEPDNWTKSGGANTTVSKDLVNYESEQGYAVKITQTAAGGSLRQDLPLRRVAGQYVTLLARLLIPAGQEASAGRIGFIITDGGVTTTTVLRANSNGHGDFRYAIAQIRVPKTATRAQVILYCDSTTATGEVTYDRVVCVTGLVPRLPADGKTGVQGVPGPAGGGQMPYLSTFGKEPSVAMLADTSVALQADNSAVAVPLEPAESLTLAVMQWISGAATSGNYDIGIYSISGSTLTRLWAKGSTAWPAINTRIAEAVSPTVELAANTRYYVIFAADNQVGTFRGEAQVVANEAVFLDGTAFGRIIAAAFPLPASLVLPATPATRIPMVTLRTA